MFNSYRHSILQRYCGNDFTIANVPGKSLTTFILWLTRYVGKYYAT